MGEAKRRKAAGTYPYPSQPAAFEIPADLRRDIAQSVRRFELGVTVRANGPGCIMQTATL